MPISLLYNSAAACAAGNLRNAYAGLNKALEQLATGSRINSAADDPAGLSMVWGMQANIAALDQSITNTKESIGRLQVADGALMQVTSLLNRAVTLATESANGVLNPAQRHAIELEYQSILGEIDNIGRTTTYNQQNVFGDGQAAVVSNFSGDSSPAGASIDNLTYSPVCSSSLGDSGGAITYRAGSGTNPAAVQYIPGTSCDLSNTSLDTADGAQQALALIHSAIAAVGAQDGYFGAQINMLNARSAVLTSQEQNTMAALNAIQAVDYAAVTSEIAKYEILIQTGIAALAQANSMQKQVLKLLDSMA